MDLAPYILGFFLLVLFVGFITFLQNQKPKEKAGGAALSLPPPTSRPPVEERLIVKQGSTRGAPAPWARSPAAPRSSPLKESVPGGRPVGTNCTPGG